MHIQLNREVIQDKIYGCWLGKNIGGTIGGPFEGKREVLNISGSPPQKVSLCPMMTWIFSWCGWLLWRRSVPSG